MSNPKSRLSINTITKVVFRRFFAALFLFTIALIVTVLFCMFICSQFVWYSSNPLYRFLNTIRDNLVIILIFCWLAGFFLIFLFYWKKTLGLIQSVADASNALVSSGDDLIHLPAELRQIEDKMNQVKQEALRNARLAKEAEQRKNDLIMYLAHDLKTPLTSVIGYLTLLRDEPQISEELRQKYMGISLEKAERLEDLINEFFDITRFNLSKLTLETSRINLTRMLQQVAYEFKPILAEKNLQYTLDAAPDIEIKCDADKLERVFDNLVRNAVNYSFENSTIEITAIQNPNGVTIGVLNHGNTIPEEKLKRIFEQFYRLDTSRATNTGGAGLGLAIAKEIVELHHGTITAASENEQIRFIVCLPTLL